MRSLWRRFQQWLLPTHPPVIPTTHIPRIVPRSEHALSRADITEQALKVLYRLRKSGFSAYLVGGGVRDLLLGKSPKDFDVATDATPEQVRKLFRNSRIIGRRFKLVHVTFGREVVEVATSRAQHATGDDMHAKTNEAGLLVRDNVYGTLEQDAFRRDFTVNALYYNISDFTLVDFTHGLNDLRDRLLRMIGDPETRYREDPVRMIRAIRFASKLGFSLAEETAQPIATMGTLLHEVSNARLFDELLKLFHTGAAKEAFILLDKYQLLGILFPALDAAIVREDNELPKQFIIAVCQNTDLRVQEEKPTTAAFLFATLLWWPLLHRWQELMDKGQREFIAFVAAADIVLQAQTQIIAIPRRIQHSIREIWELQIRLNRQPRKAMQLIHEPLFRAGFDFFLLRATIESQIQEKANWWQEFVDAEAEKREQLLAQLPKTRQANRKKPYKHRKKPLRREGE